MSIASIVVIAAIVILSVAAVIVAEEPLDELFHVGAAINGFPMQPLATKVAPKQRGAHPIEIANDAEPAESAKGTLPNRDKSRELNRLVPQRTTSC